MYWTAIAGKLKTQKTNEIFSWNPLNLFLWNIGYIKGAFSLVIKVSRYSYFPQKTDAECAAAYGFV